jgi:hypothetical protein
MQCHNPISIKKEGNIKGYEEVPCGVCLYCLEQRRSIWTYRILQELKVAETAKFVTLTYDEKYLPYTATYGGVPYKNGVWEPKAKVTDLLWKLPEQVNGYEVTACENDLVYDDLRLYIQQIRNYTRREQLDNLTSPNKDLNEEARRYLKQSKKTGKWSPNVRYFACGEYGNKSTKRAHFHIILFNTPLRWYQWDPIHEEWYSNKLENLWGKGMINVQDVTRGSAHYVAKYTIKELIEDWEPYDIRKKPFSIMSKNPGIGANYTNDEQIRNYFNDTETNYTHIAGGYTQSIGRYYKDKIWPKEEKPETPGVQVWPRERKSANKKSKAFINEKTEKETLTEIIRTEGDILQAEENIREQRIRAYKNALRIRKNNHLKKGGTL